MSGALASAGPVIAVLPDEEWWRRAVVYQVYPRSFADSDGNGIGDLRGVIGRLDYLKTLGVDVVWLSPIYASPHDDNGYDISDYQAIDPAFGTMNDFDDLVAGLHARGMRLVMDLVVNHTSDEHPWFIESASGADSAKRNWYWWRPPREGSAGGRPGAEPTNWGSFFSGSTWEWDRASGEYYLHLFSRKQPDLNWENAEVRQAVYAMMRWWLRRGIDGFRMDVINLISKDPALPDGAVAEGAEFGDGFPHYNCGPRIHEFLQEMNREVFGEAVDSFLTVGEMPGVTIDQAALFTDPRRREVNMVFQFEHVGLDHGPEGKWSPRPLGLPALKQSLARWQLGLAESGWNSLYWNNHDQPRVVSRFGNDREYWYESATTLAAVLHLMRGTPYIYQGEELGMTNAPFPTAGDFRDIETLNYLAAAVRRSGGSTDALMPAVRRASRDNARTPMQWSADQHAGFTSGTPWIPVNPNHTHINAADQVGAERSVFEFYRALIGLRHTEPLVTHGEFELLLPDHEQLFAYRRRDGRESLVVVANCSVEPAWLGHLRQTWGDAAFILGNAGVKRQLPPSLAPWEVWIGRLSSPRS